MFFKNDTSLEEITKWMSTQLSAVHSIAKNGIDVSIKPHQNPRTNQQNRFLAVIIMAQIRFFHDTGFMASGLQPWMHQSEILRFYWKNRFGIDTSAKLSTKGMTEYIDFIQNTLVEESNGEWQVITTDSMYLQSLIAGYLD
jgi:hypothetical protein